MRIEEERDRYREALEKIKEEYGNWQSATNPYIIASAALTPQPQHREEEVVRWTLACSPLFITDCRGKVEDHCHQRGIPFSEIIELTGTRRVEVKSPVKRREEIFLSETERANKFYQQEINFKGPVSFFAEWEE